MGKLQEFDITFTNNKVVYGPGESISGTVKIRTGSSLPYKGNNSRKRLLPNRVLLRGALSPPLRRLTLSSAQINFEERVALKQRHAACAERFWSRWLAPRARVCV